MGGCWLPFCSHRSDATDERDENGIKIPKCSLFRFPRDPKQRKRWEDLARRDFSTVDQNSVICGCHFKDGKKENGPTMFHWNKDKLFDFPEPEAKKPRKRTRKVPYADQASVNMDHAYPMACGQACQDIKAALRVEIEELKAKIEGLSIRQSQPTVKPFSIHDIKDSEEKMLLYTSLQFDVFTLLAACLKRFKITYYRGWTVVCLLLEDQLLLTLMKLRLNLRDLDLGQRFLISTATVSNIFNTFVIALNEFLFKGILDRGIPSQLKCKGSMPLSFQQFQSARIAIDATETTQDIPSDLDKKNSTYSSYKSRHTVKAVTGVAPNATLVYVSSLYPGCTSDVAIVRHSGLLKQFKPGDLILADKGFTIKDQLPDGVCVNMPPFLRGKTYFTPQEAELTYKVGRARIHVERVNERFKNFAILDHIGSSLRPLSTEIFQVCCCLVNLQAPMLREISENYQM